MWVMKYDKGRELKSSVKLNTTGGTEQFYTLKGREFLKYAEWSSDDTILKYEKYEDENVFLTQGYADGPFFRVLKKVKGGSVHFPNKIKQIHIENGFLTKF